MKATVLLDDIDNSRTATHQARFSFQGKDYEIDLCRENYEELELFIRKYVNAARDITEMNERYAKQCRPKGSKYKDKYSVEDVRSCRAWAVQQNIDVPRVGLVKQELMELWRSAGSPVKVS